MRADYIEDNRSALLAKSSGRDYPAEIEAINRRIYNLTEAIAENGSSESLNAKLTEMENQKEIIEAEYRLTLSSIETTDSALNLVDKFIADIKNTLSDPNTIIFERQRVLRLFIARIEILPDRKASISYFLPGSAFFSQSCEKSCGFMKAPPEGFEPPTF